MTSRERRPDPLEVQPAPHPLRRLGILAGVVSLALLGGSIPFIMGRSAAEGPDSGLAKGYLPMFSACSNEPAGYRTQVDIGFSALPSLSSNSSEGTVMWFMEEQQYLELVTDSTAPRDGKVLQMRFPKGQRGGEAPAKFLIARENGKPFDTEQRAEIYTCFFIKRSADWSDNGNVGTKAFFIMPEPGTHGGSPEDKVTHFVSFSDAENPTFCWEGGKTFRCERTPAGTAPDGIWHKIESHWIAGKPGVADGVARLWVDGKLLIDKSDVMMFNAGQTPRFDYLMFWPTFGGGTNPVPHTQYIWLEHLYVSIR